MMFGKRKRYVLFTVPGHLLPPFQAGHNEGIILSICRNTGKKSFKEIIQRDATQKFILKVTPLHTSGSKPGNIFSSWGQECLSTTVQLSTGQSRLSGLLSHPLNWVKRCSANSLFNGNLIIQSSVKNLFKREPSQGALPVVHWKGICYGVRYYFIPVKT